MRKTTVYLEEETISKLRRLSEDQGRSKGELIREAVRTYTAEKVSRVEGRAKRPVLKGIGAFRSGHTDTSVRAREILREAARRGDLD